MLGGIVYVVAIGMRPLPIVAMVHLFIFIVGLLVARRFLAAYYKTGDAVFNYFVWAVITPVWCAFFMATSAFYLTGYPKLFGFIGWNLGMTVHMVGFALYLLIVFYLIGKPMLGKAAFWIFLIIAETVMLLSYLKIPEPMIAERGITVWNISQLQGNLIAVALVAAFVPISLFFMIRGLRSGDRVVKIKALLIGGGILLNTLGEGFLGFGNSVYINGPAAFAVGVAYLLLMFGAFYGQPKEPKVNLP